MIQTKGQDIFVRSKFIELRVRSGEVMVTRLFQERIHQPLVFFIIDGQETKPCSPKEPKVRDNTVSFETSEQLSVNMQIDDNKLNLHAKHNSAKIGIMWPLGYNECYFADEMEPVNKRFTTTACYRETTDDPTVLNIRHPIMHLVGSGCLSLEATPNPCQFCCFYHNYCSYANVVSAFEISASFRSFTFKREALSDFYHRHGWSKPAPVDMWVADSEQMKRSLYNNGTIKNPTQIINTIEVAKGIQELLDLAQIKNCVIGSLAMSLQQIPTTSKDVDIAVDSLAATVKALNKENIQQSTSAKWGKCSVRLIRPACHVDLVELKSFDWEQTETVDGLDVLSKQGLLTMKLIGEYELRLMQPNYHILEDKNRENLLGLLPFAPFVYPFFSQFLNKCSMKHFLKLQLLIAKAEWDPVSLAYNRPLRVNAWKSERLYISVVNTGSPTSGNIGLAREISSATWHDIDGSTIDCKVQSHAGWSNVFIDNVELMGIIECHA